MTIKEKPVKGWGFPRNSRKAHYFIDGRSLCNKWMFFGALADSNDNSPDNCTSCKKAVKKLREKEKKSMLKDVVIIKRARAEEKT